MFQVPVIYIDNAEEITLESSTRGRHNTVYLEEICAVGKCQWNLLNTFIDVYIIIESEKVFWKWPNQLSDLIDKDNGLNITPPQGPGINETTREATPSTSKTWDREVR